MTFFNKQMNNEIVKKDDKKVEMSLAMEND